MKDVSFGLDFEKQGPNIVLHNHLTLLICKELFKINQASISIGGGGGKDIKVKISRDMSKYST